MSEDKEKIISEAVEKALQGDMDAINNIEDRITRSKAKAALMKAKRTRKTEEASSEESEISEAKVEEKLNFSQNVCEKIAEKFPESIDKEQNKDWIQLKPENWLEIAKWLKSNESLYFDSLQCNTGMDLGEGILESRYNLHSMKHLHKIEIRIKVSVEKPDIPSVEEVWRVADWFERETYDMFGINFIGHRDLRRILLPEDWEGWPLRKDYEEQETYHGIVVPKVKEGWE
ncbi:MAG: NADH-quinone oxidoreductase subunit C [Candidatus Neomarinimicrobiota bacterium]|nr:NADH-quinone oxidoreductase subunit C [Candidatus Neomarinimicrobiota bacterium]